MNNREIRVRFAPSPTGPLHIGGVRTALYNYLFARKNNGKFILRIEDTDQTRFVPGAEEYIVEAFRWCGISFDEGVTKGGPYGPYKQSERKALYREFAEKLVASGHAYYAFDTAEELSALRKQFESQKKTFTYNAEERKQLKNSLTLSVEDTRQKLLSGDPYVIRFKMPEAETVKMTDLIRGTIEVKTSVLDDKILFKSDGMPTYHLANVVDDHLMKISHVIRGEEWLPSLPLHVLLYEAFGWEAPQFAHLPLLLKPDGKGKLSKRDGDRLGFPVFPLQWTDPKTGEVTQGYREAGYFPEAFINMLALLGWNPGDERELFTLDEMAEAFSLERVGKSGSRFDPEKAKWFNHQYLQKKSNRELAGLFMPVLQQNGIMADETYVEKVVALVKERVNFVHELWNQSDFFFRAPESYDPKAVKKRWKSASYDQMSELKTLLAAIDDFSAENTEAVVKNWIAEKEYGMGAVLNAFRLLIVGALKGPHLFDIIALIGQEETLRRLEIGLHELGKKEA
ncbi:glutamate--tRNA ligase [Candidatus Sulfidibacterium hydrothermale]|uniref:glutamate--tRNA ligase n=1 Tax=Candidatus Sulfidibacterium hydrothermale TaxID=2875962 RepID=UPI001F0AA76F|nr:glutamate--tRNA ligase [Candidatus Sulfidibacterium hydrothermale]UBM62160.1 glutamate--tRNA ligase [Candidatus Sulfidibacterium hydrothermale]